MPKTVSYIVVNDVIIKEQDEIDNEEEKIDNICDFRSNEPGTFGNPLFWLSSLLRDVK